MNLNKIVNQNSYFVNMNSFFKTSSHQPLRAFITYKALAWHVFLADALLKKFLWQQKTIMAMR